MSDINHVDASSSSLMSTSVVAKQKKKEEEEEEEEEEKYEKFQCVARGTFGVTYQAHCNTTGATVALMEIPELIRSDDGIPYSALREIAMLQSLSHPNIVNLIDIEYLKSTHGRPFPLRLVFESLDKNLRQYMSSIKNCKKGLDLPLIKSYMFQLLKGVQICHSHGIMHRNLKPKNLLINRQGELKISNFSIARAFQMPMRAYTLPMGTRGYIAPEILLGKREYACPVDMWSVGSIFAEMINRRPLTPGSSKIGTLFKIFRILGTPTEEMWPGVSRLPDFVGLFPQWPPGSLKRAVPTLNGQGFDLLQQMICYEPTARITAKAALKHPWFADIDPSAYMNIDPDIDIDSGLSFSSQVKVIDIDVEHQRNPSYATNYVTDIMSFRRTLENTIHPSMGHWDNYQMDITPSMRSILVDWLVEVAENYHLQTETLYTAVHCVDRFLERKQINRHKLQLLGCACMHLASKIEEIYAPVVDDFVYISANTFTRDEILLMETTVCKTLNCQIMVPTAASFLPRFIQAAQTDQSLLTSCAPTNIHAMMMPGWSNVSDKLNTEVTEQHQFTDWLGQAVEEGEASTSLFSSVVNAEEDKEKAPFLAKYVCELALQEYSMLKYKPSMIAAASVSLSRRTCNLRPVWHKTLAHYTEYEHGELHQCEHELWHLQQQQANEHEKKESLKGIYEKYSSSKFKCVSLIPLMKVFPSLDTDVVEVLKTAEEAAEKAAEKVTEDEYFGTTAPISSTSTSMQMQVSSLEEVGLDLIADCMPLLVTHGLSLVLWKYWILPYINPSPYTSFCLRRFCRLFRDALSPPRFTTFPHPKYLTLKTLVDRINAAAKKDPSKAPKLLIIANGVHRVDGDYATINCSLTLAGVSREKTVVEGGFKIRGKKEHHVGFETMTVWNSKRNGFDAEGGALTHCTNVSFDGCKSDGVRVTNTKCTMTNCRVTNCQGSGIVSCGKGSIHIHGVQTQVTRNGVGLRTLTISSKINLHSGLRISLVSHDNNHKDWSGEGTIEEIFVLKLEK